MKADHKSIDYEIYRCLLNQLTKLNELGYNDSPEADIIRDHMDYYWRQLRYAEKKTSMITSLLRKANYGN